MVESVGVDRQPVVAARKGALDGAVQQPGADPAADIAQRQTEEVEFVASLFEISHQIAVMAGDVQFVVGLSQ